MSSAMVSWALLKIRLNQISYSLLLRSRREGEKGREDKRSISSNTRKMIVAAKRLSSFSVFGSLSSGMSSARTALWYSFEI